MMNSLPLKLATIAFLLAVEVVLMGGFTRITDSGLGCPDWPGCFGSMVMTNDISTLENLQQRYPEIDVQVHKGWIEMIHRYIAAILGLIILMMVWFGIREAKQVDDYPLNLSLTVLGLVVVQGAFGAWTVTMKLLPIIVTLHLIGGLIIVSTLMRLRYKLKHLAAGTASNLTMRPIALVGVGLLFIQIILGGWVSTNYAGWSCPGVLGCAPDGSIINYDFRGGFTLIQEVGPNYEGGQLGHAARAAIQMVHRFGALVVTLYWLWLLWTLVSQTILVKSKACQFLGLLVLQIIFGYANVIYAVPDSLAFIHHALGVFMLLVAWSIAYETSVPVEEFSNGSIEHA